VYTKRLALFLAAAMAVALVTGAVTYYQYPHPAAPGAFRLEFARTGGIAGVSDILMIRDDGSATLSSTHRVSFNGAVGAVELSELKHVIAANLNGISPKTLQAQAGAADYFGYRLAVTNGTETTQITWVDQWAVTGTFPHGLNVIQGELQKLMTDLTARQGSVNTNSSEAGGLLMTVLTDKSGYRVGEQVNFAVILENTGSSNFSYGSPTPCNQDVRVVVSNGSTTQDITANGSAICTRVLQGRILQAGTYVVQSGYWDLAFAQGGDRSPASPGVYTISAVFPYASFEKTLVGSSVSISVGAS
jgi:hypothetical protein